MNRALLPKIKSDKGFTLVELLVVIIIIGILATVAIPAFLNQRQRANDAAVITAVKSYADAIESYTVENPNVIPTNTATYRQAIVDEGARKSTGVTVKLYVGTTVKNDAYRYVLCAYHDNGKQYTGDGSAATPGQYALYDSRASGIISFNAGYTCEFYATMN